MKTFGRCQDYWKADIKVKHRFQIILDTSVNAVHITVGRITLITELGLALTSNWNSHPFLVFVRGESRCNKAVAVGNLSLCKGQWGVFFLTCSHADYSTELLIKSVNFWTNRNSFKSHFSTKSARDLESCSNTTNYERSRFQWQYVLCLNKRWECVELETYLPSFVTIISVWCSLNFSHSSLLWSSTFITPRTDWRIRAAKRSRESSFNEGKSNKTLIKP